MYLIKASLAQVLPDRPVDYHFGSHCMWLNNDIPDFGVKLRQTADHSIGDRILR